MKKLAIIAFVAALLVAGFALRRGDRQNNAPRDIPAVDDTTPLAPLDAHDYSGVHEISKDELIRLMTRTRPLTQNEKANLDRGCPGLVCIYQRLGLKRWPEEARGTRAYLGMEDALKRPCPAGQRNFIFVKQAWWDGGHAPVPVSPSGEVPLLSITRIKVGGYTFNYAVYFPETATYAWIDHREYGFPINLLKPQHAYLSLSPPPLETYRPAQIFCSDCR